MSAIRLTEAEALALQGITKEQVRAAKLTPQATRLANSPCVSAEDVLAVWLEEQWPGIFQRQVRVVPTRRFRWDFADPVQRLAIEVDGWANHAQHLASWKKTHEKDQVAREAGWTILRFPAMQVLKDIHTVLTQIAQSRGES